MKAIVRVPTVQFGYIELEIDSVADEKGNLAPLVELHNELVAAYEKTKADVQKLKDDNF